MTTLQIEQYADPQSLKLGDFDIKAQLKLNVIPEFMEDVGYVVWRRRFVTANLGAGLNYLDVPSTTTTFGHLKEVYVPPYDPQDKLAYIGEEPQRILTAKANTTAAKPAEYWMESDGNIFTRIYFQAPADVAYTMGYAYDIHIKFSDVEASVQLNTYIPEQFQWALVEGLKRELYRNRNGVGDPSFVSAAQAFEAWKQRAKKSPELAQKRRYLYAR
jgi:hypothetical protein